MIETGARIGGRYRVERRLASGGQGAVYAVHDEELDVPVALKTLLSQAARDPKALARFKQEVLLARAVSHPNVCRIFDIGRDETRSPGMLFLTMELLPGGTLEHRIGNRLSGIPPGEALPLVRQMVAGLAAAHSAGIVHRDFKSANVMIVPDGGTERAVVADFGIACLSDPDRGRSRGETGEGAVIGTPAYMAPEQVMGRRVGPLADVYALGVVLFEMLTLRLPFTGSSPVEIATRRLTEAPPTLSQAGTSLGEPWESVVRRAMEREPTDRFPDVLALLEALEGEPATRGARPVTRDPDATRPIRRPHAAGAPAGGRAATRTPLPRRASTFVGRVAERRELLERLASSRLVTLVGLGGTGKTRLALEAAEQLRDDPDEVRWVSLAPLGDPERVVALVAAACEVSDEPGAVSRDALVAHLAGRRMLLVLDNCEHLIEPASALAAALLERGEHLRILATSREPLAVAGEALLRVSPMCLADARALFLERARAARPDLTLDAATEACVTELVRRLDCIPLAIELAAARVRAMPVEQVLARLEDRFRLLTGGARDGLDHHQTLRAMLDWSFSLLSEPERAVLRRAGVFAGGFPLEAAEAVLGDDAIDALDVLDLVTRLVDKSLLRYSESDGEGRYQMLDTVRDYARGRLAEVDEEPAVRMRHLRWLGDFVKRADRGLRGDDSPAWLARYEREHDNLRQGLDWSPSAPDDGPELGLEIVNQAWRFWELRGHLAEGRARIARLLEATRDLGPSRGRASALNGAAAVALHMGDHDEARRYFEEALTIFEQTGNLYGQSVTLSNLGAVAITQRDAVSARAALGRALAIERERGEPRDLAGVQLNLGVVEMELGGSETTAEELLESSLAILREHGPLDFRADAAVNLGALRLRQGDATAARALFMEALATYRAVEHRPGVAGALKSLAKLASVSGDPRLAARLIGASDALVEESGGQVLLGPGDDTDALLERLAAELGAGELAGERETGSILALEELLAELEDGDAPR